MIFDDHDVRDDWNTSHAWRLDMQATTWWEERITGALMSYWVYQHLGNLSPAGLAADADARGRPGGAATARASCASFAQAADREADGAKGAMWSYRRDLGRVRLLVIDSRCGRILADGQRSMVGEAEFALDRGAGRGRRLRPPGRRHIPAVAAPRALHDIESGTRRISAGSPRPAAWRGSASGCGGRSTSSTGRRSASSFDRLTRLFARIGRGDHGEPAAGHDLRALRRRPPQLRRRGGVSRRRRVAGLPDHLLADAQHDPAGRCASSSASAGARGRPGRRGSSGDAGVPALPIGWHHPAGPLFGNELGLLAFDGRSASVTFERALPAPALVPGEHAGCPTRAWPSRPSCR